MIPVSDSLSTVSYADFDVIDVGRMGYVPACELQLGIHEEVRQGVRRPTVILVEHDPVITISRRPGSEKHLLASSAYLAELGIDVQPTDRGGDITYHGPGQLVAYPILPLQRLGLNIHSYMRWMEEVVIETVRVWGITAYRHSANTGVWTTLSGQSRPAKLCAMGIRVKRHVSLHGLALNVTTNLAHFQTIVPCGLSAYSVTSLQQILQAGAGRCPLMQEVKARLIEAMGERFPPVRSIT